MIGATGTPDKVDVDEVRCFVCGCTDEVACPGGCWWAADDELHGQDVCNRCVELRDDLTATGRPVTLSQLAERTGEERDEAAAWVAGELAETGHPFRALQHPEPLWIGGLEG